ncbi:MAG TPA: 4-hydroxy-tetrahydrodipicolinate synthase [Rhodanobacteraceae bacterium]|nr:4-hydroxy-tetrahydrodipicolinate synthase [Rhodanobacteraceae bacterium]
MHISGSICALATPFDDDGALDLPAFERLLKYQLDGGTEGVVVAGSTGEAHMLGEVEFDRLLTCALTVVDGAVPVIAGTGAAATSETVAQTRRAASIGADAALVVTPYYVRPTQDGLRRHFLEVADRADVPIILYNVPSRCACDMQPQTVASLRDHEQIIGIKEAVGEPARMLALAELAGDDFVYLSGDDGSAGEAMLGGADGVVSVLANLVPRRFRAMCDAARGGDRQGVAEAFAAWRPLMEALECAPNPIPVKAALAALELCGARLRAPLYELEPGAARDRLTNAVRELAASTTEP